MKKLSMQVLLVVCLCTSTAMGHGVLMRESQAVGDYQIIMEATADVSTHYERFPITYVFVLLNKDGSRYVPFDAARVMFGKDRGALVVNAKLDGPRGTIPGVEVEASMPESGGYTAEVTFLQQDRKSDTPKEIAKGAFKFEAKEMARTEVSGGPVAQEPAGPAESRPASIPPYVWALVLFIAGIALGKFSSRIYKWAF
jgi:hypothetical protein